MKTRIIILVALITLLLVGGVAWARSESPGPGTPYIIQQSVLNGTGYSLSAPSCQMPTAASGGRYHLAALAAPGLTGSGCCCNYLPFLRR